MKYLPRKTIAFFVAASVAQIAQATDYTTTGDGAWNAAIWTPGGVPNTDAADNATIEHNVTWNAANHPATGDVKVASDQFVTINGGTLTHDTGNWMRIAEGSNGTINIDDGTLNVSAADRFVGGLNGGNMTLKIGNGTGAPGSAAFNTNGKYFTAGTTQDQAGPGTATIVINSDGVFNSNGGGNEEFGNTGNVSLTMNGGQILSNSGDMYFGQSGSATVVMHSDADITHNAANWFWIGQNNGSVSSVTMNDNATITTGANQVHIGRDGNGTLTLNNNADFTATAAASGTSGRVYLAEHASGNATLNLSGGSFSANGAVIVGESGNATVNHTGGSMSVNQWLGIGHGSGSGTYNMDGGTLSANLITIGEGSGPGIMDQTDGTVTVISQLRMGYSAASSVYNLEGGTLRANDIDLTFGSGTGAFNWGGGTLAPTQNNVGSSGVVDFSTGTSNSPLVQAGTVMNIDGNVSTGYLGGSSILDLGGLYLNLGVRQDLLNVTGNLDVAGLTVDISNSSVYNLRPFGFFTEDVGTIPLVTAGSISGSLAGFLAPVNDGRGFSLFGGAVSDPNDLDVNTWYLEQTGTQLLFHYKLAGTVPEPGTLGLLVAGAAMLRQIRSRNGRKEMA